MRCRAATGSAVNHVVGVRSYQGHCSTSNPYFFPYLRHNGYKGVIWQITHETCLLTEQRSWVHFFPTYVGNTVNHIFKSESRGDDR
jgi:hypothetical protein